MSAFPCDYIKYAEPTLMIGVGDDESFKNADLMLFDKVDVFNNFGQTFIVIAHTVTKNGFRDYFSACGAIDCMTEIIRKGTSGFHAPSVLKSGFAPMHSEERYCEMVERSKGALGRTTSFRSCSPTA